MVIVSRLNKTHATLLPALVIALVYFASLNYALALDGAETTYFGFPLPWNSRSAAYSLAKEIYVLPLVLDLAFWTWVSIRILLVIEGLPKKIVLGVRLMICFFGLAGFVPTLFTLALNELFFAYFFAPGPFQIVEIRIGFGI